MNRRRSTWDVEDSLLSGRYRLGDPRIPALDVFATRFAAHDELLDRPVDVLVLHDELLGDPSATALFAAGVAAPARVTHSAVLGIFDAGTSVYRGRNVRWAVREPLRGTSVDGLTPATTLSAEDGSHLACDVARQVAELVHVLHDQGMTHGNLGPSTVIVTSAPGPGTRVKVVGFGPQASDIERLEAGPARTQLLQRFAETVRYAAPEREGEGELAPRPAADVYGFGVMLDTLLLTVEYAVGPTETLLRLGQVAAVARAEDPAQRFASAAALRAAVVEAIGSAGAAASDIDILANTDTGPDADTDTGTDTGRVTSGVTAGGAPHADAPTESLALVRRSKLERRIATATALRHELTRDIPRRRRRRAITRSTALALTATATVALLAWSAVTSFGPAALSSAGGDVVLPTVAGQSIDDATRTLVDAGVSPAGQRSEADASAPTGQVIGTDPAAGTTLDVSAPVTLIVSSGPDLRVVPALTGRPLAEVDALLDTSGLVLGEIRKRDGVDAAGTVLVTVPSAGADAPAGSTVALVVASGRSTIPADLAGLAPDIAAAQLEALGFSVRFRQEPRDDQPTGVVAATTPAAGSSTIHGTVVTVTVAVAVPPTTSSPGAGHSANPATPTPAPPRPTPTGQPSAPAPTPAPAPGSAPQRNAAAG